MLVAGLAHENFHVDQSGAQHLSLAVDDVDAVGGVAPQVSTDIGYHAVAHQQAARLIPIGTGIDEARVDEYRGTSRWPGTLNSHVDHRFGK